MLRWPSSWGYSTLAVFRSAIDLDKISRRKALIDGEAHDKESARCTTNFALPRFWFSEYRIPVIQPDHNSQHEKVTHVVRNSQHEIAALQARIVVEAKQAAAPTSPAAPATEAENSAGLKARPFKMFYKDVKRHLWLNPSRLEAQIKWNALETLGEPKYRKRSNDLPYLRFKILKETLLLRIPRGKANLMMQRQIETTLHRVAVCAGILGGRRPCLRSWLWFGFGFLTNQPHSCQWLRFLLARQFAKQIYTLSFLGSLAASSSGGNSFYLCL